MAKILIVDDLPDNIQLLRFCLEDDNHEVIEAHNGYKCLALCESAKPDLVLLDMMMPGISGIETLRSLKNSTHSKDIPVIMVSADDSDKLVIEALDADAYDYVSKPVIFPVLAARIRSAIRLKDTQADLNKANKALEKLASLDPLTGLYNRRHFITLACAELSKSQRSSRALSLILLDADNFKVVNDTFGHGAGDNALVAITNSLRKCCRDSDIIGRLGGEEFYICCPEANLSGAVSLAERIRIDIQQSIIQYQNNDVTDQFGVTVSIGVTEYKTDETFEQLSTRADLFLYKAKNSGRNRVSAGYDSDL